MAEPVYVLTIQWRSWERTVEVYRSSHTAHRRLAELIEEHYPGEECTQDEFADHGHSWYIDEAEVVDG